MKYQVFSTDHYPLPLPPEHRFPETKYRLLRQKLVDDEIVSMDQILPARMASVEELCLAHSAEYVRDFESGEVDPQIVKRIGLPWSPELYRRSAASVGGALMAIEAALRDGAAGCLAGGTHHAHEDRGEGYCVFNDLAVGARWLKLKFPKMKVAIVDLDVHQGNGNSSILANDKDVYVASIHGAKNYPFKKIPSSFDIALPDGVEDKAYLEAVALLLENVSAFQPDYVFYQMGVDPLKEDKLGKMNLTFDGLMKRDQMVFDFCLARGCPVSLALGGGYADPIDLSVQAYANTYRVLNQTLAAQNR